MSEDEPPNPWQQVPDTLPRFQPASMCGIGAATILFVLLTSASLRTFKFESRVERAEDGSIASKDSRHVCGLPTWLEMSFRQRGPTMSTTTNIVWTNLGMNAVWVLTVSGYCGRLTYHFVNDYTPFGHSHH